MIKYCRPVFYSNDVCILRYYSNNVFILRYLESVGLVRVKSDWNLNNIQLLAVYRTAICITSLEMTNCHFIYVRIWLGNREIRDRLWVVTITPNFFSLQSFYFGNKVIQYIINSQKSQLSLLMILFSYFT